MPMLRGNRKALVPFIIKPQRFSNYSQIYAEMREIKNRNKNVCPSKSIINDIISSSEIENKIKKLGDIFALPEKEPSLEEIIQSAQEERVLESFVCFEQDIEFLFNKSIRSVISNLKKEKESKNILEKSININDVRFIENNVFKDLEQSDFSDPLLGMLFKFLNQNLENDFSKEKEFLEQQFIDHVNYFYKINSEVSSAENLTLSQKIQEYVKMRYNKIDLNIAAYDGRYIYAELYILIRCGLYKEAEALLAEQTIFEEHFVDSLENFFRNTPNKQVSTFINKNDDFFKVTIYKLITIPSSCENNLVLSTFEDVIWANFFVSQQQESIDFNNFNFDIKQSRTKLLVAIMTKNYSEAVRIIINGEFSAVDTFFLGKELLKKDDRETILFVNFVFLIIKQCSSVDTKLKVISSISFLSQEEICLKLIEFDMLEILSLISDEYKLKVIELLRNSNNKILLLKLHYMSGDVVELYELLSEALIEEINSENVLKNISDFSYYDVYTFLKSKNFVEEQSKLSILTNFLQFKIEQSIESLSRTDIFKEDCFDIIKNLGCTEKIIMLACEVINKNNHQFYAKKLVELANKLRISNFVQQNLLKKLIYVL